VHLETAHTHGSSSRLSLSLQKRGGQTGLTVSLTIGRVGSDSKHVALVLGTYTPPKAMPGNGTLTPQRLGGCRLEFRGRKTKLVVVYSQSRLEVHLFDFYFTFIMQFPRAKMREILTFYYVNR